MAFAGQNEGRGSQCFGMRSQLGDGMYDDIKRQLEEDIRRYERIRKMIEEFQEKYGPFVHDDDS